MKQIKRLLICAVCIIALASLLVSSGWAMKSPSHTPPSTKVKPGNSNGPQLTPSPISIDEIIHNVGNIVTTVDNMGYIGGYRYYGYPSGEWPRNSGHDYIGEIKYWMGGVTPEGDTLVDNTNDDFQGVTNLVSGNEEYKILLSTDTSRYVEYNTLDTVGISKGNPANGWRVWDPDSNSYVYTKMFNPQDSTFYPSGPMALQVSNFRFNDIAGSLPHMGLEITHTMLQWNYCYNEDITFVILDITNKSAVDYTDFAVGLYIDLDVGGFDGTGENGRLGDVVAYDSAENLAWTYDQDGYDPGWGANVTPGIMGTKLLETPDNIGMTALRTGEWEQVPSDNAVDDIRRYNLINATTFDPLLPPADQYYIQCTRGISLTAGKTVRVVYALIAGEDEEDFRANADRAQYLYDKNFVGPQPPATPTLMAIHGDHKVYLSWDGVAEESVDPLSGIEDFSGYKLYRSNDQGKTWGKIDEKNKNTCLTTDYIPIAKYRVEAPGDPIPRSYIDTGLSNDIEYWYCLSAFDIKDTTSPFDVLQTGFGSPEISKNVVSVTPVPDPAGSYDAVSTVEHHYIGSESPSDGNVIPIVFNTDSLQGSEYKVTFADTYRRTYWYLINNTTGDTLLANQTKVTGDAQLYDVIQGLRVVVRDGDRVPDGYGQTANAGTDSTLVIKDFLGPAIPYFTGNSANAYGGHNFRAQYEIRFSNDSTIAPSVLEYWIPAGLYRIPFEIWNMFSGERVSAAVYDADDDGVWTFADPIAIVNYPYDSTIILTDEAFPFYYSWMFDFDESRPSPSVGDVYTIEGAPLNGPEDEFTFKVDGVNPVDAKYDLKDIKVVPDPYFASYSSQVETTEGRSVITFQNIPNVCTIRIYTLAGDLVKTIEHTSGTGEERWNLLSVDEQQVASGIYLYHVESPYGERLGRFAIIK